MKDGEMWKNENRGGKMIKGGQFWRYCKVKLKKQWMNIKFRTKGGRKLGEQSFCIFAKFLLILVSDPSMTHLSLNKSQLWNQQSCDQNSIHVFDLFVTIPVYW